MNTSTVDEAVRAARELIRGGRLQEAEDLSLQLRQSSPGVAASLLASEIEEARSEFAKALDVITSALELHGEHAALLLKRAQILMNLRRRTEAFAVAERAVQGGALDPRLLLTVAQMHMNTNDPGRARPLLYRALELSPADPLILYNAALCHFYLNEIDDAAVQLQRVLTLAPTSGFALHVQSQLRTWTADNNHIASLRAVLSRPRLRDADVMLASFALAKELEDVGQFEESFAALMQANRVKRRSLTYDVGTDVRAMANVATHYSTEAMDGIAEGDQTPGPVFIVGMPRTGTTLVERILASHADVGSVGEAVDFPMEMAASARSAHARSGSTDTDLVRASRLIDFGELGRNYLAAARQLAGPEPYFVDKLPFNFRYCGLIHKALPKASIVHLIRDPMDTCYAVFKTLFINAYHFAYQLDELAEYYVAYRRMMDHWHAVMPGVILDVRYEELVSDPETQCRRLLAHCGLPWQDEVLDFHRSTKASTTASTAQVRQPFYRSSVQKWRNYAAEMQPVVRRLAEAGLVDAGGSPLR